MVTIAELPEDPLTITSPSGIADNYLRLGATTLIVKFLAAEYRGVAQFPHPYRQTPRFMRRPLLPATTALVLLTACAAVPPPTAPTQARCPAGVGPSPFKNRDASRILVADFSTRATEETDLAERFQLRTADELRRLARETLADPARRGAEPAGDAIEVERLHCAVGDHAQAHALAEALGADYVVWGSACEAAGEVRPVPRGAPDLCPRFTVHRRYAELRQAIAAGGDILATVNIELPRLRPDDPLPLVYLALGLHFRERTARTLDVADWRLAARFFHWSTEGVAAGAHHREILDLLAGRAYMHLGDIKEAYHLCSRGRAQAKGAGPGLESCLALCIADILKAQGDGPGTLERYQEALRLAEEARDDGVASIALVGVGTALISKGDVAAGIEHLRRSVAMAIRANGADNQETGMSETSLADALEAQGDFTGALEHYRRALAILEKALGAEHVMTGLLFFHVGHMLAQQGDLAGAIHQYARALVVFAAMGAPAEPQLVMVRTYLGAALRQHGEPARALEHLQQALALARKVYGPSHPEVATLETLIGRTFFDQGDHAHAHEHAYRALVIVETLFGSDAPQLIDPLRGIAAAQGQRDDLHDARTQLFRALAIARRKLGLEHATTGRVLTDLGLLDLKRAYLDDGPSTFCGHGLRILSATLGPDHPDTHEALTCVAMAAGRKNGWKKGLGAVVVRLESATAAALQTGDWIVAFDGKPIRQPAEFAELMKGKLSDRAAMLTVVRQGKRIQVPVPQGGSLGARVMF